MFVVGLTGGIAAGKSIVSARLAEKGAAVVDADKLAREVVEPGTPGLAAIVERFGPGVLQADGSLDRPALGAIVFSDAAARKDLEAITHPAVRALSERRMQEADGSGSCARRRVRRATARRSPRLGGVRPRRRRPRPGRHAHRAPRHPPRHETRTRRRSASTRRPPTTSAQPSPTTSSTRRRASPRRPSRPTRSTRLSPVSPPRRPPSSELCSDKQSLSGAAECQWPLVDLFYGTDSQRPPLRSGQRVPAERRSACRHR